MRIIAGEFRGRRLLDPGDQATRPITDRVKQSIFDVLGHRLAGVHVFDVFAGTGSFGLEAVSRGAAGAVFFERHRPAVERLRRNIETLGIADRCSLVTGDVFTLGEAGLAAIPQPGVLFIDPPYPYLEGRPDELRGLLQFLIRRLEPEGLAVFRQERKSTFEPGLRSLDDRTWGSMRVRFLTPP